MSETRVRWRDELRTKIYHQMFVVLGQKHMVSGNCWSGVPDHSRLIFRTTPEHYAAFKQAQADLRLGASVRREKFSAHESAFLIYRAYAPWRDTHIKVQDFTIRSDFVLPASMRKKAKPVAAAEVKPVQQENQLKVLTEQLNAANAQVCQHATKIAQLEVQLSGFNDQFLDLVDDLDRLKKLVTARLPKEAEKGKPPVVAIIGIFDTERANLTARLDGLNKALGDRFKFKLFHGKERHLGFYNVAFFMTDRAQHTHYENIKRDAANMNALFIHIAGSISALMRGIEQHLK